MTAKVAIIGLGDIAQKVYMPLLSADEQVEIVGLYSRTASTVERIGRQYRIAGQYGSVEQLLRHERPDIVFVHSPTPTHEAIVMECLEAGVHVYVDKPLCYRIEASERMAAYAAERNLLLAVGFNRRFAPLYREAKRRMAEAGGFELVSALKHRTKLQSCSAKQTLYDDLIHMLDLLLWLGGDDAEVGSYKERTDEEGRLLLASGALRLGGDKLDGTAAHFAMARRAGADLEKLELHGSGCSMEVVNLEKAVWMERGVAPQELAFGSWDTIWHRRGFAGIVRHVLDTLADPLTCEVRADAVLPVHRLVESLHPGD
ncbi:virulence factor [Paenibacillus sp. UNCCL117]|uniref:Gfo/Idh/MocA family protein n=1 Tax=unclassified Paenibacillus TaxID=185978 RepID=UPI0008902FB4|nr:MULTISPECIES: Gfo/Idh/MocA family oxidoreductase [unclassified Paenibacillus]SDE23633.1 virulence factor [Paenibacillus sp. cl123]SFW42528.1 virulence factor [Paenibacillus sp. UNCCL117]